MTRAPRVAQRAERLLGAAVVATAEVAGGDTCRATKLRLSDGTTALMKTAPRVPDGFFEAEATGLRWLGSAPGDAAPVPDVLAVDEECLVVRWVEPARPSPEAATAFGRALAHTHLAGAEAFGAERDGFIGRLPLPQRTAPTWAEFYAVRRVLPYLKLARDRGALEDHQAARIESLVGRLPGLLPEEPPARLHGDLWNGNVVWGAGSPGEPAQGWLVDPAAYGGTSPCSPSSGCRTCRRCSRPTSRCTRWPRAGRTASRCTSSSRCWCTRACSAAATVRGPPTWPRATCERPPHDRDP